MDIYARNREKMVAEQLEAKGVSAPRVLEAMRGVPRHLFVDGALARRAYEDMTLPIGYGQTISQPLVVAWMSQLLEAEPGMRVLEIGTGSGYQSAVLAHMGLKVYTVERLRELYERAKKLFSQMGYANKIVPKLSDGTLGWPDMAPFDRIIVTAGGPSVPAPLLEQLDDHGVLVIPVGEGRGNQKMRRVRKENGAYTEEDLGDVVFVDLVGDHGW